MWEKLVAGATAQAEGTSFSAPDNGGRAGETRRVLSRLGRVGSVALSVLGGITAGVAANRAGTGEVVRNVLSQPAETESVPGEMVETASTDQENFQLETMEFGEDYQLGMTRGGLVVLGDHRSPVAFLDYQILEKNEGRIDFANGSVQVVFDLEDERSIPMSWYFIDKHNDKGDNQGFLVFPTLVPDIR